MIVSKRDSGGVKHKFTASTNVLSLPILTPCQDDFQRRIFIQVLITPWIWIKWFKFRTRCFCGQVSFNGQQEKIRFSRDYMKTRQLWGCLVFLGFFILEEFHTEVAQTKYRQHHKRTSPGSIQYSPCYALYTSVLDPSCQPHCCLPLYNLQAPQAHSSPDPQPQHRSPFVQSLDC